MSVSSPNEKPQSSSAGSGAESTTHFGFQTVGLQEKAGLVKDVFDSVANRYDLMNDLMSGGIHRLWKAALIDWLAPRPDMRLLDVGGGTGDIALRARERGVERIIVVDINAEMLQVGRDRAIDSGQCEGLQWVCGDVERLPIAENSVDAFTIAFCLRNVTRIECALAEARRVLKPGGRFLCLEFSRVTLPLLDRVYDAYSFQALPLLGRIVANNAEAYRYLAESIRRFPPQERFAKMIAETGFAQVKYRNYSGGIAAIHSAWRT